MTTTNEEKNIYVYVYGEMRVSPTHCKAVPRPSAIAHYSCTCMKTVCKQCPAANTPPLKAYKTINLQYQEQNLKNETADRKDNTRNEIGTQIEGKQQTYTKKRKEIQQNMQGI